MEHINIIALYGFLVTVLILLNTNLKRYIEMDQWLYRLVFCLVFTTIGAAVSDAGAWITDGGTGPHTALLINFFNSMLYLFFPLPALFWYLIIVYLRKREAAFTPLRTNALLIIYALSVAAVLLNTFNQALFYVDGNNYYHRGPYFLLMHAFPFLFFLISIVRVYANKAEYAMEIVAARYFWIPPLIGAILQATFYGINLYIPGIAISVMMLYIGLMTKNTRLDYLTGIHNRQYMETVLAAKMRGRPFAAIMLDINNFKSINDRYGHVMGDEVLASVSALLKSSIKKNDFVARYGGDEFVIFIDTDQRHVLEMVVERIVTRLQQFNKSSSYLFEISLSMGYEIFQPRLFKSTHDFIKCIDKHMYADKQSKPLQLTMKGR